MKLIYNLLKVSLLSGLISIYQLVLFVKIAFSSSIPGSVPATIDFNYLAQEILKIFGIFDSNSILYFCIFLTTFAFILFNSISVYKRKYDMSKKHMSFLVFLLVTMFVPIILSLIISLTKKPIFLSRNLIYSGIVFNLFFSITYFQIIKHKKFKIIVPIFTIILLFSFLYQSINMKNFNLLSGISHITQKIVEKNASVIFLPNTYHHPLTQYYFPKMLSHEQLKEVHFIQSINDINSKLNKNSSVFIFYSDTCYYNTECTKTLQFLKNETCSKIVCEDIIQI